MTDDQSGNNGLTGESIERQIEVMEAWFRERFEDPAMRTPYDSAEGGYQWIWGGPHDAREELTTEFDGICSQEAIDQLVDHLSGECIEWAPTEQADDYDQDLFDAVSQNVLSRATLDQDLASIEALLAIQTPPAVEGTYRRLLFANVIAALETFLSDTFINTVTASPDLLQRYIDSEPKFKERKVAYKDVLREAKRVLDESRKELLDTVWHNLAKVKPLYKEVLQVDLGDVGELAKAIQTRHDIVHRNGRKKDGSPVCLQPAQIDALVSRVRCLAASVEQQMHPISSEATTEPGDVPF
jgi:hypothetical protein